MAGNVAPNIVTDGLVLYLDAANSKSYVSGSTTWVDMAAGNNGTLVNGPTFNTGSGGSIVFDGVNDYSTIPYTATLSPSVISFSTWVFSDNWSARTGNQKIFSKTQNGGYALGCAVFTANQLEFLALISGSYRSTTYPLSSLSTGWKNIQGTFDGRYMNLYVNSVLVSTYDNSTTSTITYSENNHLVIAAEPGSGTSVDGNYFNGTISTTQIYNRALSATEVLQNYNATKGRFGL